MEEKLLERLSYNWTDDSERLFVTPNVMARKLPFYVQEIGNFKTFHPYYTERKNLNSFQVVYTLGGEGILNIYGEKYIVGAGDCFLINCHDHHIYYTPKDKHWDFLWVHFNGKGMTDLYDELYRYGFTIWKAVKTAEHVEKILRELLELNRRFTNYNEFINSFLINNLLTALMLGHVNSTTTSWNLPDDIKEICEYIEAKASLNVSLDNIVNEFNISKHHLCRKFKKHTGLTVNQYITNCKIQKAQTLLLYTDEPISNIAIDVGFSSASYFTAVFKRNQEMTPSEYRETMSWVYFFDPVTKKLVPPSERSFYLDPSDIKVPFSDV